MSFKPRTRTPADPRSIDALIGRRDWDALVGLGSAVVPYLLEVAPDPDPYVRGSIIGVLGRIGDRRAVAYLLGELDQLFRGYAVEALGRIGDRRAIEPLRAMLIAELAAGTGGATRFLVEALGRLGAVDIADRLVPLLDHPDLGLRAAAAVALERLAPATDLDQRIRRAITASDWHALISLGGAAVAPILTGLPGQPAEIQTELIRVLGRIGDPRAAVAVIDWLFDHPDLITEAETLQQWDRAMYPLFRLYTGMVLAVSCAVRRSKEITESTPYREDYVWSYDSGWIDRALRDLETLDTAIAVDLLHRVAGKPDAEVETGYIDQDMYPVTTRGPLSFAAQRERAGRELARRGDPPADPSAYQRPGELMRLDRVAGA